MFSRLPFAADNIPIEAFLVAFNLPMLLATWSLTYLTPSLHTLTTMTFLPGLLSLYPPLICFLFMFVFCPANLLPLLLNFLLIGMNNF